MNKKFLILTIIGIIVVGFLAYLAFKKPERFSGTSKTPTPINASGQPEQVLSEKIAFPVTDSNNNILYFNLGGNEELAFYEHLQSSGQSRKISPTMNEPDNVIWSPKRDKAILKVTYDKYQFEKFSSIFQDASLADKTITTWLFDFTTNQLTRLDINIQNINWSPDGAKIVYNYFNQEENYLAIADPDGKNWEKITDIDFEEDVNLGFVSEEEIFYCPILTEFGGAKLYKVNLQNKQTEELIKEGVIADPMLEPGGTFLLQLLHPEKQYFSLALFSQEEITDLNLESDIEKATFSNDGQNLIIAMPQEDQSDTLYKIDLQTKENTQILYQSEKLLDFYNLSLSPDNKTLYFTSDDILYSLVLP